MTSHLKVRPAFLLILALSAIIVCAMLFGRNSSPVVPDTNNEVLKPVVSGSIIVTGVTGESGGALYELALADGTLSKITEGNFFSPAQAETGAFAVIAGGDSGGYQLAIVEDPSKADVTIITPPDSVGYAGRPSWSHDGRFLAYTAERPSVDGKTTFSDIAIVLLDTESGEQVILGEGTSPVFTPDGNIVYIGESGVYKFVREGLSVVGEEGILGFTETDNVTPQSSIAISSDGARLALTVPNTKELRIYDYGQGGAQNERVISAVAYMPFFSKDGSALTYLSLAKVSDGAPLSKYVISTDINTLAGVVVANISQFSDSMLSIAPLK